MQISGSSEEWEIWPLWAHILTWQHLAGIEQPLSQKQGIYSPLPRIPYPTTSLKAPVGICFVTLALECSISDDKECEHVPQVYLCPQHMSAQGWAVHRHLINISLITDGKWRQFCRSRSAFKSRLCELG